MRKIQHQSSALVHPSASDSDRSRQDTRRRQGLPGRSWQHQRHGQRATRAEGRQRSASWHENWVASAHDAFEGCLALVMTNIAL